MKLAVNILTTNIQRLTIINGCCIFFFAFYFSKFCLLQELNNITKSLKEDEGKCENFNEIIKVKNVLSDGFKDRKVLIDKLKF